MAPDTEPDGVTLGEVNRNVSKMSSEMRDLLKDVTELKVASGMVGDKTDRLETIVYGTLATSTAGLVTAVIAALSGRQ